MMNSVLNSRVALDPFSDLRRLRNLHLAPAGRPRSPFLRAARVDRPNADLAPLQSVPNVDQVWSPAADVFASDSSYSIALEIPGTQREHVNVEFYDRILTIKGSKARPDEERPGADFVRRERSFGSFERRFRLPEDANGDDIKAAYRDGVLTVEIPKIATPEPTHIEIEA